MNDHDDDNDQDAPGNAGSRDGRAPDDIDDTLISAGRRLCAQAPDQTAARQALERVKHLGATPPTPRRSWWPALIGAGLVGTAIVGVIVVRSEQPESLAPVMTNPGIEPHETTPDTAPTSEPDSTVPSTTSNAAPATGFDIEITGGCITVATADGTATGCPQRGPDLEQLARRTFVADIGGPVIVESSTSDPLTDLTATAEVGDFATRCRWDDLASRIPEGTLIELVVCNDTGVMGVTTGRDEVQDWATSYFTLPTSSFPDGADLGPGTPIDGMAGALAFVAPMQDITTCSLLLLPDRSGWKESCGFIHGLALETALVQIDPADPTVAEIHVDDEGVITSALALEQMAPSSGCTIDDANDLIRTLPASSIVMGIGCLVDDRAAPPIVTASLTFGSVFTQSGSADGSIVMGERDSDGIWAITDSGTGIDAALSYPIVAASTWTTWPATTAPTMRLAWTEAIDSAEPQPDVAGVADQVLLVLGASESDPEFPANERLLAVVPDGLPLIVAQVDGGGDDSVGGSVVYVWLDRAFDAERPIGWQPSQVLVGSICRRGIAESSNLCL